MLELKRFMMVIRPNSTDLEVTDLYTDKLIKRFDEEEETQALALIAELEKEHGAKFPPIASMAVGVR